MPPAIAAGTETATVPDRDVPEASVPTFALPRYASWVVMRGSVER